MTYVVKPSRAGSVVAEAYRLKAQDERRLARIQKAYRTKPIAEPEAPAPSKKPKPRKAAKKGTR